MGHDDGGDLALSLLQTKKERRITRGLKDLFSENRWKELKEQFERCFFEAFCFNPCPLLTSNLAFGIPALKTKSLSFSLPFPFKTIKELTLSR